MKIRMLFIVIGALLFGDTLYAQLAEDFNPPRANCCLANTAKSLPINFKIGTNSAAITRRISS